MPTLIILFLLSSCATTTAQAWDTSAPDYGSSAYERRMEQGKNFPGDGRTPYYERESNVQRDNRELREREAQEQTRREQRRETQQDNSRSNYGGERCRSVYGC